MLQEEENYRYTRELTPSRSLAVTGGATASTSHGHSSASPRSLSPFCVSGASGAKSTSLRDIMDEEAAIEASKQSYVSKKQKRLMTFLC